MPHQPQTTQQTYKSLQSVIIPGDDFGHIAILSGSLEYHPFFKLLHYTALNFLPRGLVVRHIIQPAIISQFFFNDLAAFCQFLIGDKNIGFPCVQIDSHLVACFQKGKAAANSGFRRGI